MSTTISFVAATDLLILQREIYALNIFFRKLIVYSQKRTVGKWLQSR